MLAQDGGHRNMEPPEPEPEPESTLMAAEAVDTSFMAWAQDHTREAFGHVDGYDSYKLAQLRLSLQQENQPFGDIAAAKALAARLAARAKRAGVDVWGGCGRPIDVGSEQLLLQLPASLLRLSAQAHALVANIARGHRDHGGSRSQYNLRSQSSFKEQVKQYWEKGREKVPPDPTALSYAAVAIHCDPTDSYALLEAAIEHGFRGELRQCERYLDRCCPGAPDSAQQPGSQRAAVALQNQVRVVRDLLVDRWEDVADATGITALKELWEIKGAHEPGVVAREATEAQVQTLLDSPPSGHLCYTKQGKKKGYTSGGLKGLSPAKADALRETVKELFPATVRDFAEADPALELSATHRKQARTIVDAYTTEKPLLPVSTLERQANSSVVGLGIGTWNIRAYSPLHHVPACKDSADDKSLPHKMESLWKVLSASGLQLMALQECPGRMPGVGYHDCADVEMRLRAAAAASASVSAGGTQVFKNWAFRAALCGMESATFVYDERVLRIVGSPQPYPQIDALDGDCSDEETTPEDTEIEDSGTSRGRVAEFFRRPPVLALFEPANDGPDGHLLASPHGRLAVVSVHLKSYDGSLAQTKAEVRALAELVVPWMEAEVAAAAAAATEVPLGVTTYVIMGDFNLSEAVDDPFTAGGDAWAALKEKCGFEVLLPAGQPTNMGPPVSKHDRCYDNILYRRVEEAGSAAVGEPRQLRRACVYPVMQEEMEEMSRLQAALDSVRTDVGREIVSEFVQTDQMGEAFKRKAFTCWSDHKPVYARLSSNALGSSGAAT